MKTCPPRYYFYSLIAMHYKKGSYVAAPCISILAPTIIQSKELLCYIIGYLMHRKMICHRMYKNKSGPINGTPCDPTQYALFRAIDMNVGFPH